MLDPELQQRFARHVTDAAFGYSAATTAAYAAFADQVLSFWSAALLPPASPKREAPARLQPQPWQWPVPLSPPASPRLPGPTEFANLFSWPVPQPVEPQPKAPSLPMMPWDAMAQFAEVMSGALSRMTSTPVQPARSSNDPITAWLTAFPFPLPTAAWPMAFMMISQGVPHAIAWPTAEANAAVLDAADVARRSIQKAFASYQTESGHAAGGNVWPPAEMLTLFAAVPLNVGTMLTAMKLH